MDGLEIRRRRALWRATHRGTKEMDWLLGRYAEAHVRAMSEPELSEFERFLVLPEPELQDWLLTGTPLGASEVAPLVARIRAFHGLGKERAAT
jgi:antitoxin CptB